MSEQYPSDPNTPQWMQVAPAPPGPRGRNTFAVASLVQIGRTNQTGHGMAIAGIVLSLLRVGQVTFRRSKLRWVCSIPTARLGRPGSPLRCARSRSPRSSN